MFSPRTLLDSLRKYLAIALSSPQPAGPPKGRLTLPALAAATVIGAWVFAYKVECFVGLTTTSDLYQFTQLATTWMRGRFLEDNCYGDHLSIHTYFFCPVLAIVVVPFGAVGLLLTLGVAAAAGFAAMTKILGLFELPAPAALGWAALATLMPLSLHVYQDVIYGFHVELLIPAMALWLTYFLLRRSWVGSAAMALVLLSVKEETPITVALAGGMVLCEDLLRRLRPGAPSSGRPSRAINPPALAAVVLAAVALPVLLHILHVHQPTGYSIGSFQRVRTVDHSDLDGQGSLIHYMTGHLRDWLSAQNISRWRSLCLAATFGLIVLRPHFAVFGIVTTLINFLMGDDLMWAPRLAPGLAFFQIAGTLAFASAYGLVREAARGRRLGRPLVAVALLLAAWAAAAGFRTQLQMAPEAGEVYRLSPKLAISREDRLRADALFATYREQAGPDDPVIASPYLFRYANYRNLYWFDRMDGRPAPTWILWDFKKVPSAEELSKFQDPVKFERVGQAGRFLLYRRRTGAR